MAVIDRFWIAEKIEGRPSVLAELAQVLQIPLTGIAQLMRGERDVTATEAEALKSYFDAEGYVAPLDLSSDQKTMLELAFQLTDQEIRYLLESAREPSAGQGRRLE